MTLIGFLQKRYLDDGFDDWVGDLQPDEWIELCNKHINEYVEDKSINYKYVDKLAPKENSDA